MDIFLDELGKCYSAIQRGVTPSLPELRVQYIEYAKAENERRRQADDTHLSYWVNQFHAFPPPLALPVDFPRPEIQTYRGKVVSFRTSSEVVSSLKSVAEQSRATMFMVLLSGYALCLSEHTGQEDIVIGFPVANRRTVAEEQIIGFFVNTIPLRIRFSGHPSVEEWIAMVKRQVTEAYDHDAIPFDRLVEVLQPARDLSRPAIRQTVFSYQRGFGDTESFRDLEITPVPLSNDTSRVELALVVRDEGSELALDLEYNADLFKEETIKRFGDRLLEIFHAVATSPAVPITSVLKLGKEQLKAIDTIRVPLSERQRRFFYSQRLHAGKSMYFDWIRLKFVIRGPVDVHRFRQAFGHLLDSADALRGQIVEEELRPLLVISAKNDLAIELVDVSGASDPAIAANEALESFKRVCPDVGRQLIVSRLVKVRTEEYWWLLATSHIVCDAWSNAEIVRRMSRLYLENSAMDTPVASFHSYLEGEVANEQSEKYLADKLFWSSKLARSIETPNFYRFNRPSRETDAERLSWSLGIERSQRVRDVSRRQGLFSAAVPFLAVLAAYVYRVTSARIVRVGGAFLNRTSAERNVIGLFLSIAPVEIELNPDESFDVLLKRTQAAMVEAGRHQRFAVANPPDRKIFDIYYNYQNVEFKEFAGHPVEAELLHGRHTNVTFALQVRDFEGTGQYTLDFDFQVAGFDEDDRRRTIEHYQALLDALIESPEDVYARVGMLSTREIRQLRMDFNATAHSFTEPHILSDLLCGQAERTPEHTAVVFEDRRISYRELHEWTNRLAFLLVQRGVEPRERVAVCMSRSIELVVALTAVVKAGAAYVPIDPELPDGRIQMMFEDAQPKIVLVTGREAERLQKVANMVDGFEVKFLDVERTELPRTGGSLPVVDPDDPVYIIFTSGSTGRPKGAINSHAGVCNRLLWMQQALKLNPRDRVLQKTPFSFDVSVWEFFWPLMVGATLVVATPNGHRDPEYLAHIMRSKGISVVHFVPSMLSAFLEYVAGGEFPQLRKVICSGEALPLALNDRFIDLYPDVELHNLYGPTEAAVDVSHWICRRDQNEKCVPIGKPIANIQLYVLDDQLNLVPRGIRGELHIGGIGVGKGYLNRPELTAERFIANPYDDGSCPILYKTGDLARHRPDGTIEYLGRTDDQVKIRGLRIELGEIEAVVAQHPAVRQIVVIPREMKDGDKVLVGYVVMRDPTSKVDLNEFIRARLPDYMVPALWVNMDSIPTNHNGKADRKALPAPDLGIDVGKLEPMGGMTLTANRLAELWGGLLGSPPVSADQDFFQSGGYSLLAVRLVARVRSEWGVTLPLITIFRHPRLGSLAAEIDRLRTGNATQFQHIVKMKVGTSGIPLILIHPAGGQISQYQQLVNALSDDSPVYAIQSRITGGMDEYKSFLDMVSAYVTSIRESVPRGPCRLLGWSMGGLLAHAIAAELEHNGDVVQSVTLVDSYRINKREKFETDPVLQAAAIVGGVVAGRMQLPNFEELGELRAHVEASGAVASDNLVNVVVNWAVKRGWLDGAREAESALSGELRAVQMHIELQQQFSPRKTKAPIYAVWASESLIPPTGSAWAALTTGEFSECTVSGNHFTMLTHPAVQTVVGLVDDDRVTGKPRSDQSARIVEIESC
jgi:amino acid adenylation domain-containing protein